MTPERFWIGLAVGGGVAAIAVLLTLQWVHRVRSATPLRRLGYLPGPNPDEWTARLDRVQITWRPMSGFRVRLGVYSAAQLRMVPRDAPIALAGEAFELGDPELDARWRFSSEAPVYARELLVRPAVLEALRRLPPAPLALRGDELAVDVRRRYVKRSAHDAVLRVAHAMATAA